MRDATAVRDASKRITSNDVEKKGEESRFLVEFHEPEKYYYAKQFLLFAFLFTFIAHI